MKKILGPILIGLVLDGGTVFADELPREALLPLTMASRAASAALEKCTKAGYRVSVAVVDRATVLLASHNMQEAERLCGMVLILKQGRIVGQGSPESLVHQYGRETLEQVFIDIARDERI